MTKGNNKRGLMSPQPASALSALDFAATSEALRRARTAGEDAARAGDELATEAAADLVAELSDRLISTPISDPAKIAEKVTAYAWLHNTASGLDNPAQQRWIAENGNDAAKGLLAIYLDLTAGQPDRSAWDAAVSAVNEAMAKVEAINALERETDEDCSDEWNAAWDRHSEALEALLNLRAPDAAAMGLKARLTIEKNFCDHLNDGPDNPDTLSRLMGEGTWGEHSLAALYQDSLALAGTDSPAARAMPETFDGVAWVKEAEAGLRVTFTISAHGVDVAAEGENADGALALFSSLAEWKQSEARSFLHTRRFAEEQEEARASAKPTSPADLRAIFLNGLLNTFDDDGEREAMRASLAAIGLASQ